MNYEVVLPRQFSRVHPPVLSQVVSRLLYAAYKAPRYDVQARLRQ
jgi:hypothetical protein